MVKARVIFAVVPINGRRNYIWLAPWLGPASRPAQPVARPVVRPCGPT
jgi:hypothetical protein